MKLKPCILSICLFLMLFGSMQSQSELGSIVEEYEKYEAKQSELHANSWKVNTPESVELQIEVYSNWVSRLKKLNVTELEGVDQVNYEMLKLILEDQLFSFKSKAYQMPLNSEGGFIIGMMYATSGLRLDDDEAVENYVSKLKGVDAYIDSQINNLRIGQNNGINLPKLVVENCIKVLDDAMDKDDSAFFLFSPLAKKGYSDKDLFTNVRSSFLKLHDYLSNDYLRKARAKIGVSENKNGKAYYEQRVRFYTTLNMTPQEVYDVGISEVKRIKSEMQDIIDALEFEGSFEDFLKFLREDPQFYPKTPEDLLMHAAWLSKKAEEILPRYFGHLPRLPFTVKPVPEAIAPNYTTGRYSGGSMKRQKAGEYWVNTYNLPARPLYVLPSLTLHEAVPGHHLQISLANELKENLPKFRSHYLSAYGEGWGLYAEYLGKEAGIYTTAYEDFGRLTYEMWRACRLVVDPGMHYFDWTREEAVEFMKENTALSMHEINTEINRYIGWPAQAVSYKIGELKIRALRKKAEEELGDDFDIRDFHDLVLSNGSIPLMTLERIVNNFIVETKKDAKKD